MPTHTLLKTMLIVDDDDDVLRPLEVALRAEFPDYDIDTAGNGNKAVEQWGAVGHAVVILDMVLPGRSSFLVLEKIRDVSQRQKQHPAEKSIVIMITSNRGPRHEEYGLSLGADDYMVKPLKYPRLFRMIKRKIAERALLAKRE